ncbi:MAG: CoA ester lyase [Bacteroidales bacterium]|nr:CoA ester lyase [Bacteroidales bacterium]
MNKSKKYVIRSMMFVPGHNLKLLDSASRSNADALLFDVEDSVQPPENKILARKVIVERTQDKVFDNFYKFARINEIGTEFFLQDVIQLTEANLDGFLLSKTESYEDVKFLDNLLTSIEIERGYESGKFKIVPILETTKSIVNTKEIATASDRIIAIGFGSEDFVSDLQGVRDFGTDISIFNPRAYVAIVARAYNLEAIDAAYINVHDLEGLEKHLEVGKTLGYGGMWVLHPKQNSRVNRIYSPTKEEYLNAKRILELNKKAKELKMGVAIIEGTFIGPPVIIKANNILNRIKQIKLQNKESIDYD